MPRAAAPAIGLRVDHEPRTRVVAQDRGGACADRRSAADRSHRAGLRGTDRCNDHLTRGSDVGKPDGDRLSRLLLVGLEEAGIGRERALREPDMMRPGLRRRAGLVEGEMAIGAETEKQQTIAAMRRKARGMTLGLCRRIRRPSIGDVKMAWPQVHMSQQVLTQEMRVGARVSGPGPTYSSTAKSCARAKLTSPDTCASIRAR